MAKSNLKINFKYYSKVSKDVEKENFRNKYISTWGGKVSADVRYSRIHSKIAKRNFDKIFQEKNKETAS